MSCTSGQQGAELAGLRAAALQQEATVAARESTVACLQGELEQLRGRSQAVGEALRAELEEQKRHGQAEVTALKAELEELRRCGQAETNALRAELEEQRRRGQAEADALRAELEVAFEQHQQELAVARGELQAALEEGKAQTQRATEPMAAIEPETVKRLLDEFICSICQDYLTDPVITNCGHNFCRVCINRYWDKCEPVCPECREACSERELVPNVQLRSAVRKAKGLYSAAPGAPATGDGVCQSHKGAVCTESQAHKDHTVLRAEDAAQDHKATKRPKTQSTCEEEKENFLKPSQTKAYKPDLQLGNYRIPKERVYQGCIVVLAVAIPASFFIGVGTSVLLSHVPCPIWKAKHQLPQDNCAGPGGMFGWEDLTHFWLRKDPTAPMAGSGSWGSVTISQRLKGTGPTARRTALHSVPPWL
ncbi:hypothetical protein KIL84_004672 [Mauremys mutica]|uniref:RING-type domain-containing protein n=1 Tax=Mauremys mutica TaxID=74926 RepID=A0A9D4B7F2_9SAUR|nr:hypothetical protein KIL84_004672 [Mauremys mutica]